MLLPLAVFAAFLNATIAFAQAGPGSWMATGIYTGNGQANHAITGVGFTPDVVIIKGGLDEATMVRTSTMPSGHSKPLGRNEPLIPGTIQSLDADGFTLNTDRRVNLPITLYYWVAFRAAPGLMKVGSYIGNGIDNRNIVGLEFQPSYVIVMNADGEHAMQRFESQSGDQSLEFTNSDLKPDRIQALLPNGFQVGKHNTVNQSGRVYHYVAWNAASGIVASGGYVGNGLNRDVVTGFQPAWTIIKRIGGSAGVHRPESVSGNITFWVDNRDAFANGILALQSNGFRLGPIDPVNKSGDDYCWAAFRDLNATGVDLMLAKTVNDSLPNEGAAITFTIDLTNAGPDWATGVRVMDPVPAGLTFVSNRPSQGSYAVGSGIWTVGSLAPNANARLELDAIINSQTGGSIITNRAGVHAVLQQDTVPGNDVDSVSVRVQSADIGVTKNVDDPEPHEGDIVTFGIALTNAGPDRATSAVLIDSLPAGLSYVSSTPSQGTYSAATGRWTVGNIPAGATRTLMLVARVDPGTAGRSIANRAAMTHADQADPESANNADVATVAIVAADLSLNKTVDRPNASEGDTVRFTVGVANLGPHPATAVSAVDVLPAGLTYVSSSGTQGTYTVANGLWTVGSLASGGSATLTLVATIDEGAAGTSIVNTAVVNPGSEPDPIPGNNTDTATIAVEGADLELTKQVDRPRVAEGDTARFTLKLRNLGPRNATGAEVTDTLPSGLTLLSASASQGTYASGTGLWQAGSLVSGDSATLLLSCRATVGTGGTVLINTAAVTGRDQPDPVPENDVAEASLTVAGADLAVTLAGATLVPNEGDTLSFQVALYNLGADDTNSVAALDLLPPGLTYLESHPSQGTYVSGTGIWNVGSVATGDTASLNLVARVDPGTGGGSIVSTVGITTADLPDPHPNNNADTLVVNVQAADLSVSKTTRSFSVNVGDAAHFQITVRNAGPNTATRVALQDTLPAGLLVDTAIPSRGSYDVGTGLWNIGPVAAGDSTNLVLIGEVQAGWGGTTLVNVAGLTAADQADPTPDDRADSAEVYIPVVDLTLNLRVDDSTPAVGDSLAFTLTLQNAGPDSATAIEVAHFLPSSLSFISASPANGAYADGVWTLGALAAGDSATLIVETRVVGGGGESVVHSGEISASDQEDSDPSGNSAAAAVMIRSAVALAALPQAGGTLLPGADPIEVLRLRLSNVSAVPETLTSVRITNRAAGTGTTVQLDASWSTLSLYIVENGDFPSTPRATAVMDGGGATFSGIAAVIAPSLAVDLLVKGGASLTARDSDLLDVAVESSGDLVFSREVGLSASFPLEPSGVFAVDGMSAAQIAVDPLPNSILTAGSSRTLLLEVVLPANGYEPDVIERLNVINSGSASDMTELTRVEAWTDDGDSVFEPAGDRRIGDLTFTGSRWEITGIAEHVPAAGLRVFFTCDVSELARAGETIRLELPPAPEGAIGMTSGNDGPLDRAVSDLVTHTVAVVDRVVMAGFPILPSTAAPGDRDRMLLHLVATNTYPEPKIITALTLSNLTAGSGSVAQRDGEIARVNLRADADGDGELDGEAIDPTLGTGFFSASKATFTGFDWLLAPNETRHLFFTVNLSLTGATDGDVLAAAINAATDVSFANPTAVAAAWPLDSGARETVDGMVANQLIQIDAPVATLGQGEGPALALDIEVPRNGYLNDDLRGLRLRNLGTARVEDLDEIRLWQDGGNGEFDRGGGDDLDLGVLTPNGTDWVTSLLSVPLHVQGARLFAAARAALEPADSVTVRLEVPDGGVIVDSNNDGPIDHAVANANAITLSTSALLSTLHLSPPTSTVGQTVTAHMVIRNAGTDTVTAIIPSLLLAETAGFLQLASGPIPATGTLAPAQEDTIVWTFMAEAPGEVQLSGSASGFASGLPRQSLTTQSNTHRIFREARDLALFPIESMPFSINRGQEGVVPLSLTFAHPGGANDADIELLSLRFRVENELGTGIVPATLLSRVIVSEGANVFLDKTGIETAGAVVDLPLARPVRIETGGGQVTLSLVLAISDSTQVPNFRLSIPDSTWFSAHDAVGGGPAAVLLQGQPYPVVSGLARIGAEAVRLEVVAGPDSSRSVGRGQEAVPLLHSTLLNADSLGLAADVRVGVLRFGLRNAAGTKIADPEQQLSRVRVRGPFQTHYDGAPIAQSDSLFTLELSPLLSVPANTPLVLAIEADVAEGADLGSFRARLGDPASLDARDANTGDSVNVVYLTDPIEGATITVTAPAETLSVRRVRGISPTITVGQTGVSALTILLAHPGTAQVGSVRLDSLRVECRDQLDRSLNPADVVDRTRVLWNGMEAGLVTAPGGGAIAVPLANARLAPGDSLLMEVLFDVEPTTSATFIELKLPAEGLHAVDDNLGDPVAIVAGAGGELPLRSGLSQLQPPARELRIAFASAMPPVLVADGSTVTVATLTLNNTAAAAAGPIDLDHMTIRAADRDLRALAAGLGLTGLQAVIADTLWAETALLAPADSVARLQGADTLRVEAGHPVVVELRAILRPGSRIPNLRVGCDAAGIGVVQPGSALLAVRVEPNPGQAFPFWSEVGNFSGLSLAESYSNFPNPFAAGRQETHFAFYLDRHAWVTLRVWNGRGERVRSLLEEKPLPAGLYQDTAWDGLNGAGDTVFHGVYLAELIVRFDNGQNERLLRKVAVVR